MSKKNQSFQASILIFFFYASAGTLLQFFYLLFRAKGFSIGPISFLLLIPNFFILFAGPIWASVADIFNIHKRILFIAMVFSIPSIILLSYSTTYIGTLITFSIFAINFAPLLTMTDNSVLDVLGNDKSKFGRIRLWGAVSFGLTAWVIGILADDFGIEIAYWIGAVCMVVAAISTFYLTPSTPIQQEPYWKNLQIFMGNKIWLIFLLGILLAGYGQSMLTGYFSAYLLDLGATNSLIGLSIYISTLSEIPIMLFSPFLLKRFSPQKLILISIIALVIRYLGCIQFIDFIPLIATQALHGFTSALFWISAIIYTRNLAPIKLKASALAILGAVYYGLGGVLGNLLGGQIYANFGARMMFISGAITASIGLGIFLLIKKKPRSKEF